MTEQAQWAGYELHDTGTCHATAQQEIARSNTMGENNVSLAAADDQAFTHLLDVLDGVAAQVCGYQFFLVAKETTNNVVHDAQPSIPIVH